MRVIFGPTQARRQAGHTNSGSPSFGEIHLCSIRCLRQFLMDAVDELERLVAAVEPGVRTARGLPLILFGSARRG
jgi:hypothetical protein